MAIVCNNSRQGVGQSWRLAALQARVSRLIRQPSPICHAHSTQHVRGSTKGGAAGRARQAQAHRPRSEAPMVATYSYRPLGQPVAGSSPQALTVPVRQARSTTHTGTHIHANRHTHAARRKLEPREKDVHDSSIAHTTSTPRPRLSAQSSHVECWSLETPRTSSRCRLQLSLR